MKKILSLIILVGNLKTSSKRLKKEIENNLSKHVMVDLTIGTVYVNSTLMELFFSVSRSTVI